MMTFASALAAANPTDEDLAMLAADLKENPFVFRQHWKYEDGRQWEVVEQTNNDWRECVGLDSDFKLHGHFETQQEAETLYEKLAYRWAWRQHIKRIKKRTRRRG